MKLHIFLNINTFLLIVVALNLTSCNNIDKHFAPKKSITEVDRYYSELSSKKGMNAAFLAMFDSSGVILRANHFPIEGYNSIKTLLIKESDSNFTLTWEPSFSKTSSSGDLGYTYGTYQIVLKATDSIAEQGTYCTVWQQTADGSWKAILDTGNPGLGKKKL